ncbi:MAG TPA: hypothetical protein VGI67_12425 [Thermoleophilaceae bacterium]|jgi:hypothetical protein
MQPDKHAIDPLNLVRDIATRAVLAVGLAGIALIHLLDSINTFGDTRYLFWMYMALIAGCLVAAGGVLFTRSRLFFLAAAGLAAATLVGFVLSRTTGLPSDSGDIGNWTEPLGLASMFVEGAVVALAGAAHAVIPARHQAARRLRAVVLAEAA